MKLKDLLAEGRFDMEKPEGEDPMGYAVCGKCDALPGEECGCDTDDDACPGCGRRPGDGYGDECNDPTGCGYWKDWAKTAASEWKRDGKSDGAVGEGVEFFDKYMSETLWIEERRAKQLKAPVVAESIGKIRQKRVQESPANRIRMQVK